MNLPHVISTDDIQNAYIQAVEFLSLNHWQYYNLVVQISDIDSFDERAGLELSNLAKIYQFNTPKVVASTIVPYGMYNLVRTRQELYDKYNSRLFKKAKAGRWGTYFNRMIAYNQNGQYINQLENIISKINSRRYSCKAAYTMQIQYPGNETSRLMGGPCLNYLAVQIEYRKIGLLAVYRNHDFLERAYGNYLGLCNLIKFISLETDFEAGSLTCISSHAYIDKKRHELLHFCRNLNNGMA